jgi:hypothetical protein
VAWVEQVMHNGFPQRVVVLSCTTDGSPVVFRRVTLERDGAQAGANVADAPVRGSVGSEDGPGASVQ